MLITFLVITHILAFLAGLFIHTYFTTPVTHEIQKILSKKAEIINPINPIEEVDLND